MRKMDELINAGSAAEPSGGVNGATEPSAGVNGSAAKPSARANRKIGSSLPDLLLPSDGLTKPHEAQEAFFRGMATTERYFVWDEMFVEVEKSPEIGFHLHPIAPKELPGILSKVFTVKKEFYDNKGAVGVCEVNCDFKEAELLLAGRKEMLEFSHPLRLLSASPVLVERDGEPVVLHRGYHADAGGIYITGDLEIPEVPWEGAGELLKNAVVDYDFVSKGGDLARAVALMISPTLKRGNLLDTDFPLGTFLADQSQSGKTHLPKIFAAIYGEKIHTVTKTFGGPSSLDEALNVAFRSGKLFILVDNARGDIDSQFFESAIKGSGEINTRGAFLKHLVVNPRRYITFLTSNGAHLTKDLAARSIVVSHRKQPPGYKPRSPLGWGEKVFVNLRQRQAEYLGAIYAVVGEWIRRGKPGSDETCHAFLDWVAALDYIVREILGLAPLMEGQSTTRQILSDWAYGWLREVALKVEETGQLGKTLQVSDIGDLCDEEDIRIPGLRDSKTTLLRREDRNKQVGINLKKIFEEIKPLQNPPPGTPEGLRCLELEVWEVERWEERAPKETKPTKKYRFVKKKP
jgi:hypothetical protein